jgi:hypothetical protein
MISWLLKAVEFLIDNTPVIGRLKTAIERDFPDRQLSVSELSNLRWRNELVKFLNESFEGTAYDEMYTVEKIADWLTVFPSAFIVIVRRKLLSWPLGSEQVVGSVKLLPLRENLVSREDFDPFFVDGKQLAAHDQDTKAVWVGDLVSRDRQLLLLIMALRYRLTHLAVPVYCRTANKQLRRVLFERYGARVLKPMELDADAKTILVIQPGF